jgi:hypothetical protein
MTKWFEELTNAFDDDPKELSIGNILDGEISFENGGKGVIEDNAEEKIAQLEMDLSADDFSPSWRLMIPAERWEQVEIVCDGNALDVDTEPMPDGRYKVKRTIRGFRPMTVVEESVLELPTFATTREFIAWIETLDTDAIEALRQIYYDRWNFNTASQRDRMYFTLLDEEKQGRK